MPGSNGPAGEEPALSLESDLNSPKIANHRLPSPRRLGNPNLGVLSLRGRTIVFDGLESDLQFKGGRTFCANVGELLSVLDQGSCLGCLGFLFASEGR